MPCIDDDCPNANFFKIGVGALPIDAGALHHDEVGLMARTPVRQGASISFEGTKGPTFNLRRPVRSFDEGTGGDLGLMHIEPDHPFVQGDSSIVSPVAILCKQETAGVTAGLTCRRPRDRRRTY